VSAEEAARIWAQVRNQLRYEVGEATFKSWLKPLTLLTAEHGKLVLSVSTRFMRDWIDSNYAARICEAWKELDPEMGTVEVVVLPRAQRPQMAEAADRSKAPTAPAVVPAAEPDAGAPQDCSARLDPRLTFENFVVGKPNEFAYAAARRVSEARTVPFNPLFLYGGVGLGKTHLMHAIAWDVRRRHPGLRLIYLTAEKFMHQLILAIRYKDTVAFKERFRSVHVLMIDDVQFFGGKDSTQDEFFHTFNELVDQNHQIVISADKSPSDLHGLEERLRSRLGWGLVADIHPTTYELRLGILQAKAERAGLRIPGNVLEFLAHRITSNVRELEGALNKLVHSTACNSDLAGGAITIEVAQEVLRDLLRASVRAPTIEEIQKKVAAHYNVKTSDMHSARRSRAVARPRQVAMFLSKQLTPRSLPEIGRQFGGRDHTTVMHAVRKVEQLCAADANFAEDIDLLRRSLER